MKVFSVAETNRNRRDNKSGVKYPDNEDPRCSNGLLAPAIAPDFRMQPGQRIFTMGSCFARNIERLLHGYEVPTREFQASESDPLVQRGNTVLNEYNPGTMAYRINRALDGGSSDLGILAEEGGYSDYLITGSVPAPLDVVKDRRARMDRVYAQLRGSDVMVITLGMTECWFDRETGLYLNRAPAADAFRNPAGHQRFEFRILNVDDCVRLLQPALSRLAGGAVRKIILTVSPVPLQRTFGQDDAVTANTLSKATLRCAAEELIAALPGVDYFPSYEMVTTYMGNPFGPDNVHVLPEVVAHVTKYMLAQYEGSDVVPA